MNLYRVLLHVVANTRAQGHLDREFTVHAMGTDLQAVGNHAYDRAIIAVRRCFPHGFDPTKGEDTIRVAFKQFTLLEEGWS